ncbi:hypothetical protein DESC_480277 [Desulfosarcina cetonica]|nr:hypothetical protein DESC_480277 [Desulfosarcina cetonica]
MVDEAQHEDEDHGRGDQEDEAGQADDAALFHQHLTVGAFQGDDHIQGTENFFLLGVDMTVTGTAARLVADGADDAKQPIAGRGGEDARALIQGDRRHGGLATVADMAGLGLDVGGLVDLLGVVGVFDFAGFVVNADVLDFRLAADVVDDLVDLVAGVEHHGVVGAQADRGGEAIRAGHDALHHFLLLIADIEKGPGGDGDEQNGAHGQDQLGGQAVAQVLDYMDHGALLIEVLSVKF